MVRGQAAGRNFQEGLMNVLLLAPDESPLLPFLKGFPDTLIHQKDPVTLQELKDKKVDFIVSYNYRHIIKKDVIEAYDGRAINMHISVLPWNRGADPNFWSFIDHTPKGVTIHYMDAGIDSGDVIYQQEIPLDPGHTLKTSYEFLHGKIVELFKAHWNDIKSGKCPRRPQTGKGSFHNVRDRTPLDHLIEKDGWDTPVSVLENYSVRPRP
jgi:methionyl-tRNA formyltransferase